jgi:glycosyltransferase involved in cell wall biosynthesis
MKLYLSRAIEILRNEGFGPLMRALGRKVTAKMCENTLAKRIALPLTPENSRRPVDLWDTLYAEKELHKARTVYTSSGKKRVAYFTNQLLDWVDQRPRYGGGERYCLNLSSLLRDLGFEVDLYQIAFREFTGEYHGYHVKAIPHGDSFCEFNIGATEKFHKLSLEYDHVIYNLPELSSGKMRPDAIAICHGIWFDHNNYARQFRFRTNKWFCYLYRAFKNPKKIVSVDTNSVNVIRALWPELATKMTVIPNFVDMQLFFPPVSRNNPKPLILFPRRSQINRGSRILADILKNVPRDVDFYWVGEGDDYDTKLILDLCKKDQRLHYANASFEEMPEWYRKADIVVIPTIACEGTSLSCIEALASGCATIATNVGGLTDIIQNEVNGLLVNPTPIEIADAIDELIKDPQKREHYQKQGFASSAIFSIDKWRKKWLEILTQEKWIDSDAPIPIIPMQRNDLQTQHKQICIITRNAIHGGVESLIKLESEGLGADVIVAGGLRDPFHSCPFPFTYVETYEELRDRLKKYDVVVYSWPYDWAVQAIRDSGLPSIEVVHRTDTAECDKSVPSLVVTHSQYLIEYLKKTYGIEAVYLPNAIDTQRFFPSNKPKAKFVIGAITSYYDTKGVDLVLRAWALIAHKHPDVILRFYGAGSDLERYKTIAEKFRVNVEFCGPTSNSALTLREYSLFIHASRIEGLPIVVLEALATNLPVIASNIDGHTIINHLAEEKGFGAPLTLFETENFQDLAKKIAQCLAYPIEPNGREVVEAIFSAEIHNAILQQMLYTIAEEHPKTASVHFECIDRSWNNGVARKAGQQEGFHTVTFTDTLQYQLSFTHRSYLIYDYIIPKDAHAISCLIYTANNNIANVFVQFNWCTEQDGIVSDVCGGRLVDEATEMFYSRVVIPANHTPTKVQIIARPNPKETLVVDHIEICAWKKI